MPLITLSQIAQWAAMKPPIGISFRAKLAWRRFAPIELEGKKFAFPAKNALIWMKSTGVESMFFDWNLVRGQVGRSKIAFKVYSENIPCEEPYNLWDTKPCAGLILDRCQWSDMTVDGKTNSTVEERKEAAQKKKKEKAEREYSEAQKKLNDAQKALEEAEIILKKPLIEAITEANKYLELARLRRSYYRHPVTFPAWMSKEDREEHSELANILNAVTAQKAEYKPIMRWPSYFSAKDKKACPDMGFPVYGPKWNKLTEEEAKKKSHLLRFIDNAFYEYVESQGLPHEIGYAWLYRPYSRARLEINKLRTDAADLMELVENKKKDLQSLE